MDKLYRAAKSDVKYVCNCCNGSGYQTDRKTGIRELCMCCLGTGRKLKGVIR